MYKINKKKYLKYLLNIFSFCFLFFYSFNFSLADSTLISRTPSGSSFNGNQDFHFEWSEDGTACSGSALSYETGIYN